MFTIKNAFLYFHGHVLVYYIKDKIYLYLQKNMPGQIYFQTIL